MAEESDLDQLEGNECIWGGEVTLPSWRDFKFLEGRNASLSPGTYCLEVIPIDDESNDEESNNEESNNEESNNEESNNDASEDEQTASEQQAAVNYLLAHESAVHTSILCAVFERHSAMQHEYGKELVPDGDLEQLIELSTVYVHPVAKDGIAYIGFLFHCVWDDEHGLGVMTHKDRVVDIGGADTAFLEWIAEKDAAN